LGRLKTELFAQILPYDGIEVLCDASPEKPVGTKRNDLIAQAKGEYVVFIDDDDKIAQDYISSIMEAIDQGPDAVGFRGYMTTNGQRRVDFEIRKGHPYGVQDGKILRWHNHICPIKREIASQFRFPEVSYGEDYAWSKLINDSGLIQTEVFIDKDLYHYDFRTGIHKL
jgi:glycosyltransferase involved in cell wall biosynthesis